MIWNAASLHLIIHDPVAPGPGIGSAEACSFNVEAWFTHVLQPQKTHTFSSLSLEICKRLQNLNQPPLDEEVAEVAKRKLLKLMKRTLFKLRRKLSRCYKGTQECVMPSFCGLTSVAILVQALPVAKVSSVVWFSSMESSAHIYIYIHTIYAYM